MQIYDKIGGESARLVCPRCDSEKVWKDGVRKNERTIIQRYICRVCGFRFSGEVLSTSELEDIHQVCVTACGAKNLVVATQMNRATGANPNQIQLLKEYENYIRKQGLQKSTISGYLSSIRSLINNNVNLEDPESVKEYLVGLTAGSGRKRNIVHAYKQYYRMLYGIKWADAPKYKRVKKPQYLAKEEYIIQIISALPNKYPAFCQLLYETGARSVEAWNLLWSDIDFDMENIDITPVKNGEFRTLPISQKLMHMLKLLQNDSQYVFKKGKLDSFREGFRRHRKNLADKLGEPEILNCSFKTFRTLYATKMSYIILDPFDIQYRMGHTKLDTTSKYIRRKNTMNRLFTSIVTRTIEEAQNAVEQGYTYVTDVLDVKLWQKPK